MKIKLLRLIIMASKSTLYGFAIQCLLFTALLASTSKAQQIESVRNVYVELELHSADLITAFRSIESKTDYKFAFDHIDLKDKTKISISKKKISVADALMAISEIADLKFRQVNNYINVNKLKKAESPEIEVVIDGITITGRVRSSEDNEGLPGVNVVVKGTSQGTVTDVEGNYSLEVPSKETVLVYSSVGFIQQNEIVGNRILIDVKLSPDVKALDEIVVTALGISREKKSIGYAVQELDGAQLTEAREPNLINALAGKIAGVQVVNGNGTVGASSNILIRGSTSISGKNQPLFVVDGVPINNETYQTSWSDFTGPTDYNSSGYSGNQQVDYGNAGAEINPDDIESMTVLKGANAAALYGSRAANGVILITTKSGKGTKGIGVSFSSNITFETPLKTPEYQTQYGKGRNGQYEYVDGLGGGTNEREDVWGPRLDGQSIQQYDPYDPENPKIMPWISRLGSDPVRDLLETGITKNHNFSIVGGYDKGHFRLSYSNFDQSGMAPNTNLKRNSITMRAGYNITKKFKVDASVNYINSNSDNRPNVGTNSVSNPMFTLAQMGQNEDLDALRQNVWEPQQEDIKQAVYDRDLNNPFFYLNESENGNRKDRVIGSVRLSYNILPNLFARVRVGKDFYTDNRTEEKAWSSSGFPFGNYQQSNINFVENNTEVLLDYQAKINDWDILANAGGNMMSQETDQLKGGANGLVAPGVFNIGNYKDSYSASNYLIEKKINSIYGLISIGFRNYLYLDVTGRNDWSSALPVDHNSYFYPSVSLSAVVSEMLEMPEWVSFLKLRGSAAQVGNDTDAYKTTTIQYEYGQGWLDGYSVSNVKSTLGAPDLKPEIITSYEFGFDLRFMDDRVSIDFSAYKGNSINQILPISMPSESGYEVKYVNAGELQNQGMELMLNIIPIKTPDFTWNLDVNWARNTTEVIKLTDDQDRFHLVERWINIDAVEGEALGAFYGDYVLRLDPETNKLGQEGVIVHRSNGKIEESDDGVPLNTEVKPLLGNVYPDWTGGIMNTFTYKDFSIGFLFDIRRGGEFYSRTFIEGNRFGALQESVNIFGGREHYDDPNNPGLPYIIGEGVKLAPGMSWGDAQIDENDIVINADEMFIENDQPYPVRDYIQSYYDNDHTGTFDASYVKLREVKIGFRIPKTLARKLSIESATISLIGRNLMLWDNSPHVDPETSGYSGIAPGVEMFSFPSARSIGYNLSIRF